MDSLWLVPAAAGIAGFILGSILAGRGARRSSKIEFHPQLNQAAMAAASDRSLLLATLRRELANIMIREDAGNYLRIYREAHMDALAIPTLPPEKKKVLLDEITAKYPMYSVFDFLASREHVLYADAVSYYEPDQIEQHFKAMVRYQAILAATDPAWNYYQATDERNLKHLEEYVDRVKDTRLSVRPESC